ncbi:hypothetical protein [Arcanobacterium canis]
MLGSKYLIPHDWRTSPVIQEIWIGGKKAWDAVEQSTGIMTPYVDGTERTQFAVWPAAMTPDVKARWKKIKAITVDGMPYPVLRVFDRVHFLEVSLREGLRKPPRKFEEFEIHDRMPKIGGGRVSGFFEPGKDIISVFIKKSTLEKAAFGGNLRLAIEIYGRRYKVLTIVKVVKPAVGTASGKYTFLLDRGLEQYANDTPVRYYLA